MLYKEQKGDRKKIVSVFFGKSRDNALPRDLFFLKYFTVVELGKILAFLIIELQREITFLHFGVLSL